MSEVWQLKDHPENRLAASSALRRLSKSPLTEVTERLNIIGIDILIIPHIQEENYNSYNVKNLKSKFYTKFLQNLDWKMQL